MFIKSTTAQNVAQHGWEVKKFLILDALKRLF